MAVMLTVFTHDRRVEDYIHVEKEMQFFGQLSFGKFAIWMRFRCLHRSVSGIACRYPRRISLVRLKGEQTIILRYFSFNGTALTACTHFIFQCRIVDSEQVGRRDPTRTWKLSQVTFTSTCAKLLEHIPVPLCFAVVVLARQISHTRM